MQTPTNSRERPRPHRRRPSPRGSVVDQLTALASRLTDRDRAIIHLVGEHRVFTTAQIAKVHFNSVDRAEHRLRELTDARALARFRPHTRHGEGSAPFHYVLGPAGAAVLAAEQGIEPRRLGYRPDKALEIAHSQRLAHLVGVNGFFTALVGYARQQRCQGASAATLTVWWSERRCRDRWGDVVRPDGYGRWREHDREVDFFLEQHVDKKDERWDFAELAGASVEVLGLSNSVLVSRPCLAARPRSSCPRRSSRCSSRWKYRRF